MEETEKIDEDPKNETIIYNNYENTQRRDVLDINYEIKERNKYKNISHKQYKGASNNKCIQFFKAFLKIILCPFYCLLYKSFEWIWDGRCRMETYYKSYSFLENIFFCLLSIIDIVVICIFKENLCNSFLLIRIFSDFFGILIFWLSIVLWDKDSSEEKNFESGFLLFTLIGLGLMGLLDTCSFLSFCISNSDFNVIVLMCFLMHLILCIAIFSFNLCKFLN